MEKLAIIFVLVCVGVCGAIGMEMIAAVARIT